MQRNLGDVRPSVQGVNIFTKDDAAISKAAMVSDVPGITAGGRPVMQGNVVQAWERARGELAEVGDLAAAACRAGAQLAPDGVLIKFLSDTYLVDVRCGDVRQTGATWTAGSPDIILKTLLCHYLVRADGRPLAGEHASFREFPGGQVYYGPFVARTVRPLVSCFGRDPERLIRAGLALGGRAVRLGDAGIAIQALPRLPLTLSVWSGDAEIAASGSVLFDRSATGYLSLEDLVVAAQLTVGSLRQADECVGGVSG